LLLLLQVLRLHRLCLLRMKITKGRLRQIIQEELSRVLKEQYDEEHNPDHKEVFMVVAQAYGKIEFWPNMLNPRIYDNKEDANQIAINQSSKPGASRQWLPLSVFDVEARIGRGHPQYGILALAADMHLEKRAASDNDIDTDNDGKISVGELEKELQDIRDDLVDPEIEGVIAAANAAGAESWQSLKNKELSGAIDDENTVDLDDLDALAKAFKVSKTINHETEDASGTIQIGTINGEPTATWNVMGHTTWMR